WDLLHLINRAHKDAKGKAIYYSDDVEIEDTDSATNDIEEDQNGQNKACLISELIDYIQSEARQHRSGIKYTLMKIVTHGKFKRPKVWSNTRMVVYEWEMLERFLENAVYFAIPTKHLLLAHVHGLVMFSLKNILKNVQRTDLEYNYVKSVIEENVGLNAMKLSSRVAKDVHNKVSIQYLKSDKSLTEQTNICSQSEKTFCEVLYDYLEDNELFIPQQGDNRATRSEPFSIDDAKNTSDLYTDLFLKAIKKRLVFTDMSQLPGAYSEAPAEGIFSIYSRVSLGRERATIDHLIALTRIAVHAPP
ncbi:unnamed protein product, partial [Meganyctiphanes norvegica]